METQNGAKAQVPEIKPQLMRSQDEGRKGAGVGLLTKLGLGGASAGGAGGFGAGGGGLLAGKAGIVALVLAGSSVAAGIGVFTMNGGFGERPAPSSSFFAKGSGTGGGSAETASAESPAAGEVSSSLDNFHQANRGAVPDPYAPAKPEEVKDAAAAAASASPTQAPDNTTAAAPGTTPPAAGARPKMVKNAGFGSASGGGTGASGGGGAQTAGAGNGTASNFNRSANGATSSFRAGGASNAVQRHSAIMRGNGGGATAQLRAHNSTLRGNLGSSNVSSAGSGAVMDGAGHSGTIGGGAAGIAGGGQGSGAKGIDSSPGASTTQNLRDVKPPPSPEAKGENKTSYQKFMLAAMAAMAVAMLALFISSKLGTTAKADPNPVTKLATLSSAKTWAGIATAAGAVATGIGVMLMTKEGQMMQGGILTAVGAIITVKAAMAWLDDTAAESAKSQMLADAKAASAGQPELGGVKGVSDAGTITFNNGATAPLQYPTAASTVTPTSGVSLGTITPPPAAPTAP